MGIIIPSCKSSQKNKTVASKKKPSISPRAKNAVSEAKKYLGTKYKYGGTTKKGIDCSGLTSNAYKGAGLEIPRTSNAQSTFGKRVYIGELQTGDLVFFGAKPRSKKITHVGIVSRLSGGNIFFIHASTKAGVVESNLTSGYYNDRYIKATRPTAK